MSTAKPMRSFMSSRILSSHYILTIFVRFHRRCLVHVLYLDKCSCAWFEALQNTTPEDWNTKLCVRIEILCYRFQLLHFCALFPNVDPQGHYLLHHYSLFVLPKHCPQDFGRCGCGVQLGSWRRWSRRLGLATGGGGGGRRHGSYRRKSWHERKRRWGGVEDWFVTLTSRFCRVVGSTVRDSSATFMAQVRQFQTFRGIAKNQK